MTSLRRPRTAARIMAGGCLALALTVASCGTHRTTSSQSAAPTPSSSSAVPASSTPASSTPAAATTTPVASSTAPTFHGLAGMPAPLSSTDVYAADKPGNISPSIAKDPAYVYVPDTKSGDVYVIDQHTKKVVRVFAGGSEPQHVVPSYDLKTLYVTADLPGSGSLIPIDPETGKPGAAIKVDDAYNMYNTPDGRYSIVVQEAYTRLAFYNPHTWKLHDLLTIPSCQGIDHMDFTADGTKLLVSCEFANRMAVVDVATHKLLKLIDLHQVSGGMPQDVKLSPDGTVFYVADMMANGIYEIDASTFTVIGFLPTGKGAHGLYISRDSKRMFVTNRDAGSISVVDLATRKVSALWQIPGGGSPDMGNVSADGTTLWLSGRYNNVVYAMSTTNGKVLATIPVGSGPHGLCVWPVPGRYSLGHTGILR